MLVDGLTLTDTSFADNLKIASGATLPTANLNRGQLFYLNGVGLHVYSGSVWDAVGTGVGGVADNAYDIAFSVPGVAEQGVITTFVAPSNLTISRAGSIAKSTSAPTGTVTYTLVKYVNGVATNIGTFSFTTGSFQAAITGIPVTFTLNAGDILAISQNAGGLGLANLSVLLKGQK